MALKIDILGMELKAGLPNWLSSRIRSKSPNNEAIRAKHRENYLKERKQQQQQKRGTYYSAAFNLLRGRRYH